ncbi:glycosyltransferase [Capnocytophaga cynodegmi]|uniref:glycosyltransferase n=1 Tax=Capnocytophaga cynodegmi TaxID=28189 RepID=UPI00385C8D74
MINIGFVHEVFPGGGAETVTSNIAKYISKEKYKTFVFTYNVNEHLLTQPDKDNITIIKINKEDLFKKPIDTNNTLVKEVNELSIDILVFVSCIEFNIKEIVENIKCKTIFSHHNTPFWEIENEKEYSLRSIYQNKKFFLSRWKNIYIKLPKKLKEVENNLLKIYLDIYNYCDICTVLCESYKNIISEKLNLLNNDKLKVLLNGIPPAPIAYNLEKKKQLLYIGRMSYTHKRVDRLINIWRNIYKDFPDWEFIVVGDGEERQNIENQARNLERIKFYDFTKNPHEFYNNASILLMSSQFEGVPIVLLEAQQAGVVPMAFNCSKGLEEILSPSGENGILIENFNMKTYEKQLRSLMKDENLRLKVKKNILEKSKQYDMEIIAQNWDELFQSIL